MMNPEHFFHHHQRSTYQHFLRHEVVLSQPLSFHWIQQVVLFPNPSSLKQKLPLKVYIGATPATEAEAGIQECWVYDSYTQQFESRPPRLLIPQLAPLEALLQDLFPDQPKRFSILTDTAPGRGLCFFQSIATLFTALHFLDRGLWTFPDLSRTRHNPEHLAELLTKAREIYSTMTGDTLSPVFYPAGSIEGFSPVLCQGHKLIPLETFSTSIHPTTPTPFHMALIYSGRPSNAALIGQRVEKLQSTLNTPTHNYLEQMTSDLADTFIAIRNDGPLSEHIDKLFALCDMSLAHTRFIGELHPQLQQLIHSIQQLLTKYPSTRIALTPIGTTKLGGSLIVSFTDRHFGHILQDFIRDTGSQGYPYRLEYLSTRDLPSPEEGIQIETPLSSHAMSTPLEQIQITRLNPDGTVTNTHTNTMAYDQLKVHSDVFLDTEEKKIYIKGRKLTAKEIPTQTATLQLLEALFQQPTLSIASHQLTKSTYTTSKNEMTSKILIPLKRVIKELLHKDLRIEARGGLTEFHLQLYPSPEVEIVLYKYVRYPAPVSSAQNN